MNSTFRPLSPYIVPLALAFAALVSASPTRAQAVIRAEGVAVTLAADSRQSRRVLLLSDVDLRARLRLSGRTQEALPLDPLPDSLLRAALDEMVGELLIAREAARVQVADPTPAQIRAERQRLVAIGGGPAKVRRLLRALGADPAELDVMAARRARVALFLAANLQSNARLDDVELERVYASGQHPFIGQDLDDVREAMRVWLTRRRVAAAVERWVEVLRGRANLVFAAPYW